MTLEVLCRQPAGVARGTLLFVHGAWHAAWCWDDGFLQRCADAAFDCHALSLRGHGGSALSGSMRTVRLSDYVADVAAVAAGLPGLPVLVGHSMGGAVVQKYLETHDAAGAILLASVPPAGVLATTLRIHLRHPLLALKMHATLSLLPLVDTPEKVREMFYSAAMPEARVRDLAARVQEESYLAFLDMLAFNLPRPDRVHVPVRVLGAERDAIFLPREVEATARAYGTRPQFFAEMAHDMMLEPGWEAVADRVVQCAGELVHGRPGGGDEKSSRVRD